MRIFDGIFRWIEIIFQWIFSINFFFLDFILFSKVFSIFQHLFDFFFRQSSFVIGNDNFLLFVVSLICSTNLQNTIGIDFKSNIDLWNTSGSWSNSGQVEFTQHVIIFGHWSLTFVNWNSDSCLIILIGGESLGFFSRDERSFRDNFCHNTSNSFNT